MFDILGPVMIGPSSSHTAGAARIGRMAHKFAGEDIRSATFYLHGSFAKTYRGHGTDKALLAGVLGYGESDDRLRESFEIATSRGIAYKFVETDLGDLFHPNSVKIVIERKDGSEVVLIGSSIGGGNIRIVHLNGIDLTISGENPTIVARHNTSKGIISGLINILTSYDLDVLYMSFHKKKNRDDEGVIVAEVSDQVADDALQMIRALTGIIDVYLI
jgi:L-serine dehydratase